MTPVRQSKLPRLSREFYQGYAMALWTHTFEQRATGWLHQDFHRQFRETLLHACHRYALACPCYVLMPDHWHLLWMGCDGDADQWLATAFLRKYLQPALGSARLQDRAHDHVLRDHERERGAFQTTCAYVCHNPERAGLNGEGHDWPYLGSMVPGYPDLDPRSELFWERFWRIYQKLVEPGIPALTRRATTTTRATTGFRNPQP